MKGFANWLKNELTENKISQEQLAKALGINRSTVHRWLKAQTAPNVLQWNGIACFLSLETKKKLSSILEEMSFSITELK
jgi:transcriptional regulator with XRE-family HTH domain